MADLTLGIAIISFIYLYFAFKLDENHFILKLLLIFFSLYNMMLIPTTTIIGESLTAVRALKLTLSFFRIFVTYFTVYLFYHWFIVGSRFEKLIKKVTGKYERKTN